MPKLSDVADDLRGIAEIDDDLGRRPLELGIEPVPVEAGDPVGPVAPGGRQVVALQPLVLALPLTRSLAITAGAVDLIDLVLPWETPEALHDLLFDRAELSLDEATGVVDLTVDLLSERLGVLPDRDAGLADDSTALAQLDGAIAAAVDAGGSAALLRAADVIAGIFDELDSADEVAGALADLGLGETALAIRAADV